MRDDKSHNWNNFIWSQIGRRLLYLGELNSLKSFQNILFPFSRTFSNLLVRSKEFYANRFTITTNYVFPP